MFFIFNTSTYNLLITRSDLAFYTSTEYIILALCRVSSWQVNNIKLKPQHIIMMRQRGEEGLGFVSSGSGCSPHACVGSLQVLWFFSPQCENMHFSLISFSELPLEWGLFV